MNAEQYHDFVRQTDQYAKRSLTDRRLIALYGVVGEIGSLGAAVKKKLLGEDGERTWQRPNDEIIEELGDTLWYCFSLAQIQNDGQSFNILLNDLQELQREISGTDDRAATIRATLDAANNVAYLKAYADRPATEDIEFADYQELAFLTARTQGRELIGVCVAVLWQLGAELLRTTLPDIEITLNKNVKDRPVNVVLGEIAWHLCAVASVLELSVEEVAAKNVEKINLRTEQGPATPLHDDERGESEKFPRKFEVSFVSVQKDQLRMYLRDRQLGHDLDDNAWEDDGYRFHDALHLSNIAHLGWSPVFRGFMGKKRKSTPRVDRVEDGARALILEELVIKAIHSEGTRLAKESGKSSADGPTRAFPTRGSINFKFLKSLKTLVEGHEVSKNQYREWKDAILDGSEIYYSLRIEQQGTVSVDMEARTIRYSPDVFLELRGANVGLGLGRAAVDPPASEMDALLSEKEKAWAQGNGGFARAMSAKRAICSALKMPESAWKEMGVKVLPDNRVCVRARGAVQERMWTIGAISFQLAFAESTDTIDCTAIAIADVCDLH